ncbi:MAG: glycosyltransferase family 4 protein [Solirubrobacterales bacterium]|nr:glycosyltransferase family 4 protein [Solirubrobacterales bacterium]
MLTAILFYPRGGSAHAARALARGLRNEGWEVTLVAGSREDLGGHGDARRFYGDPHAVDFSAALATEQPTRFEAPSGSAPMHPSFEDRPGAPDVVFAALDDHEYELQVRTWAREIERAGGSDTDVFHLHHLTPLNEAATRVAPGVPVVSQLHGTELLMLEEIDSGPPAGWSYAEQWTQRIRTWATRSERILVSPSGVERARALLGVSREQLFVLRSGVDLELFKPRAMNREAFWRKILVEAPQGWLPGEPPGSASYSEDAVQQLARSTTFLYVGRFTAVKRLDLLIEAFALAQERTEKPAGLVLLGGHPGEWEGEHPQEIVRRRGVEGVFLAGWYEHEDLSEFFGAADAVVLSSAREQFGQVLVEGMACELPAIATRSLGPSSIIEDGQTGWLVDQNPEALAVAMSAAIEDAPERRRRGAAARLAAQERYSWTAIAKELSELLAGLVDQ